MTSSEPWETVREILTGDYSREKMLVILGVFMVFLGYPMMEAGNYLNNSPMASTGSIFWGLGVIVLLVGLLALMGFIDLDDLSSS